MKPWRPYARIRDMVLINSAFRLLANPTHASFMGGYGARAHARKDGHPSAYLPRWTTCAAKAAEDAIELVGIKYNLKGASSMMLIVVAPTVWKEYMEALLLTSHKAARELAASQMGHFHRIILELGGIHNGTPAGIRIRVLYDGLKRHTKGMVDVLPLVLPPPVRSVTLPALMKAAGHRGHGLRPLEPRGRVEKGLEKWDWSRFKGTAYVCYERAYGRLVSDFPAELFKPGPDIVDRLISRDCLPTAVESAGDHYVVISKVGDGPVSFAWMPVPQVAAALGLPPKASLTEALLDTRLISPCQANQALGESVHFWVMEDIVNLLVSEGHLTPGVPTAHGAAFAGVDVMGAAAKAVLGPALTTSVLSEKVDCRRKVLGACNPRLDSELIFEDATSEAC